MLSWFCCVPVMNRMMLVAKMSDGFYDDAGLLKMSLKRINIKTRRTY